MGQVQPVESSGNFPTVSLQPNHGNRKDILGS